MPMAAAMERIDQRGGAPKKQMDGQTVTVGNPQSSTKREPHHHQQRHQQQQ